MCISRIQSFFFFFTVQFISRGAISLSFVRRVQSLTHVRQKPAPARKKKKKKKARTHTQKKKQLVTKAEPISDISYASVRAD